MPLTPISEPPRHISAEAHSEMTSATPSDFAQIPPILRWEGSVEVIPPSDSDSTAGEGEATATVNGHGHDTKIPGTLWVTEEAVSFLPASGEGFTLPYPQLTLHALTGASEDSQAHIYCQLDLGEEAEGDEYAPLSELRIFVQPDQLQPLFSALSSCSALHASLLPSGEPSSFFGGGEWYGADGEFDNADDDDEDQDEGAGRSDDDGDDAISRFLAKVDWSGVSTPTAANAAQDAEFARRMARFKVRSETPRAPPPPMRDLNELVGIDTAAARAEKEEKEAKVKAESEQVDLALAFANFRQEYDAGWGDVDSSLSSNDGLKAQLEAAQERVRDLEARLEEMRMGGEGEEWQDVESIGRPQIAEVDTGDKAGTAGEGKVEKAEDKLETVKQAEREEAGKKDDPQDDKTLKTEA